MAARRGAPAAAAAAAGAAGAAGPVLGAAAQGREWDLLVLGVTGFTGSLVAEYLRAAGPAKLRWAAAGRRVASVQAALDAAAARAAAADNVFRARRGTGSKLAAASAAASAAAAASGGGGESEGGGGAGGAGDRAGSPAPLAVEAIDLVESPVADLEALVARASVVLTTCGPYTTYGTRLVAACAAKGTHYCDLTGEPPFTRASVEANDAVARASGAVLVHQAGYDSLPSDLTALLAVTELKRKTTAGTGSPRGGDRSDDDDDRSLAAEVRTSVGGQGGASGGTVASIAAILDTTTTAELKRSQNPLYLVDSDSAYARNNHRHDAPDLMHPRRDSWSGKWEAPWFMASINRRVVHRSASLLGHTAGYASKFKYRETLRTGSVVGALAVTAGVVLFSVLFLVRPIRSLLYRCVLPAPGQGPSRASMEAGHFWVSATARTEAAASIAGPAPDEESAATVRMSMKLDPGYTGTAVMLSEVALGLVRGPTAQHGGVHTPASALGLALIDPLVAAGVTIG